jgi:AcrR family transcriptional regulator
VVRGPGGDRTKYGTRPAEEGGDVARILALQWDARVPGGRWGRTDLTLEKVVASAVVMADAEGLAALSMRRVAEEFGVGTMRLYTHVPGKTELVEVMLDMVCGEVASANRHRCRAGD